MNKTERINFILSIVNIINLLVLMAVALAGNVIKHFLLLLFTKLNMNLPMVTLFILDNKPVILVALFIILCMGIIGKEFVFRKNKIIPLIINSFILMLGLIYLFFYVIAICLPIIKAIQQIA